MPIYALLKSNGSFEAEEVALLGKVFEDVLQTLRLVDREDPLTVMVAKSLVEYAKTGIRDPDRLKALTVQAFTQQQQQQQQIQRIDWPRSKASESGVSFNPASSSPIKPG